MTRSDWLDAYWNLGKETNQMFMGGEACVGEIQELCDQAKEFLMEDAGYEEREEIYKLAMHRMAASYMELMWENAEDGWDDYVDRVDNLNHDQNIKRAAEILCQKYFDEAQEKA